MASFTLSGFSTTARTLAGDEIGILTNSDAELIVAGDAVTSTGAARNLLFVGGTIATSTTAFFDNAIDASGGGIEISIAPTGMLYSYGAAISSTVEQTFYVQNAGSIQTSGYGIAHDDPDASISFANITNSGLIDAWGRGISLEASELAGFVMNTGTIFVNYGYGVYVDTDQAVNGPVTLRNTGTIISTSPVFTNSAGTAPGRVINTGELIGSVVFGGAADHYDGGGGLITGEVLGGGGSDTLAGGDEVDAFFGGSGTDLLVGRGGDDELDGQEDGDRILGGDGNDLVMGSGGNDTLTGNAGDDTMDGGADNDVIVGQDGSDDMQGGTGNDTMDGGAGNDILEGGDGVDVLRGRDGEDALAGGLGLDFYTGGQGADVFVFRSTAHAGIDATRDQVLDFEQGVDQINVVGMSPGVFEFRGTAGFAPSGNPELRLFETPTGSTIVQFDTNGDGVVDAEIRVANVIGLTAEDFAL